MLTAKALAAIAAAEKELYDTAVRTAVATKIITSTKKLEEVEFCTPEGEVYGTITLGAMTGHFFLYKGNKRHYCSRSSIWDIITKLQELEEEFLKNPFNTLVSAGPGAVVTRATLVSICDAAAAHRYEDIDSKHARLLPALPNGTPRDVDLLAFYALTQAH